MSDADARDRSDQSDDRPPGIRPAVDKPTDEACPWLYLHADPDARAAFVTAEHRCEIRPDEVPGPGHQLAYCLTTNHISCPQLRNYEAQRRPAIAADPAPFVEQVPVTAQQPAPEFRASLMRGANHPVRAERGPTLLGRLAWAGVGVIGALLLIGGLVVYANPDGASSDPGPVNADVPVAAAEAEVSRPLSTTPLPTSTIDAAVPTVANADLDEGDPDILDQTEALAGIAPDDETSAAPADGAGTGDADDAPTPADTAATATPPPTPEPPSTYTVRSGDTLGQIAQNLGINIVALAVANDITTSTLIYVGDVLQLPGPIEDPGPVAIESPAPLN